MNAPFSKVDGFEPLGDIIARLTAEVNQAIVDRDEEAGAAAHSALIEAEQQQLMIELDEENDELDEEGDHG